MIATAHAEGLDHAPRRLAASKGSLLEGLSIQHVVHYGPTARGPHSDSLLASKQEEASITIRPLAAATAIDHASTRMDPAAATTQRYTASGVGGPTGAGTISHNEHNLRAHKPFRLSHGRRYIRNEAYPLPCDLQELHRQNLKTLLACSVFGRPVCAPLDTPPETVLEVGCGSAYWTARCHQLFSSMGHKDIMYTGLDVAPLAPDMRKQGLRWSFVQHDIRRCPWPFDDGSFDYIMCKDLSLATPLGAPSQRILDECIRVLRVGGTLEIWESDHVIRSLLPHALPAGLDDWERKMAEKTATFPMSPTTPFAPANNRYLKSANSWIHKALDEWALPPVPCARIAPILLQEPDSLGDIGFRRIAIPLSELDWEKELRARQKVDHRTRSRSRAGSYRLTTEQTALREAALLATVQMIEALEPILKEASGKNAEEWIYWWTSMMSNLSSPAKKPLDGECLEIGAWWATKIGDEE